jgi:hypothetical protein
VIPLYDPKTQANVFYNIKDIQDPLLVQINILIEQRVTNAILVDAYRGIITNPVEQYRTDVVNDGKNPSI